MENHQPKVASDASKEKKYKHNALLEELDYSLSQEVSDGPPPHALKKWLSHFTDSDQVMLSNFILTLKRLVCDYNKGTIGSGKFYNVKTNLSKVLTCTAMVTNGKMFCGL